MRKREQIAAVRKWIKKRMRTPGEIIEECEKLEAIEAGDEFEKGQRRGAVLALWWALGDETPPSRLHALKRYVLENCSNHPDFAELDGLQAKFYEMHSLKLPT